MATCGLLVRGSDIFLMDTTEEYLGEKMSPNLCIDCLSFVKNHLKASLKTFLLHIAGYFGGRDYICITLLRCHTLKCASNRRDGTSANDQVVCLHTVTLKVRRSCALDTQHKQPAYSVQHPK